ncbi:MAG: transposase [Candidatus Marinimicrobia bacterium]|nr:transposase [Candidatus Neomarinimicrobiota bacterium]
MLISCIDGLKGFPDAIKSIFPQMHVGIHVIYLIQNSLIYIFYKEQKEFINDLRKVYKTSTPTAP